MSTTVDAATAAASGVQSRCAAGYGRYASSAGKFTILRVVTLMSVIIVC